MGNENSKSAGPPGKKPAPATAGSSGLVLPGSVAAGPRAPGAPPDSILTPARSTSAPGRPRPTGSSPYITSPPPALRTSAFPASLIPETVQLVTDSAPAQPSTAVPSGPSYAPVKGLALPTRRTSDATTEPGEVATADSKTPRRSKSPGFVFVSVLASVSFFTSGSRRLKLTRMTPVHQVFPSTPARRKRGIWIVCSCVG